MGVKIKVSGYSKPKPDESVYFFNFTDGVLLTVGVREFCEMGEAGDLFLEDIMTTVTLNTNRMPTIAINNFFMLLLDYYILFLLNQDMLKRLVFLIAFLFLGAQAAQARVLPRFRNAPVRTGAQAASGLTISAKLRADRKALFVSFGNLNKVVSVVYTLMYKTDGVDQGVSGTLSAVSGSGSSRELLFGTCSSGVCRYHQNITNMKLEVVSELPSGKRTLKRFRIRI